MDANRPATNLRLAAEMLGTLQEIHQIAATAIQATDVETFERALDDIADLACDEEHDET